MLKPLGLLARFGDEVAVLPSGKKSRVKQLFRSGAPVNEVFAPMAITIDECTHMVDAMLAVNSELQQWRAEQVQAAGQLAAQTAPRPGTTPAARSGRRFI